MSLDSESSDEPEARLSAGERKRKNRDDFLFAFQNRPDEEQSLRHFWINYPRDARPGYETARENLKKLRNSPTRPLPQTTGRRLTLTTDEEKEIAKRCEELLRRHGFSILTDAVLQGEALDIARRPRTGEGPLDQAVFERCKRVGGYYWCQSFRKRYGFTKNRVSRPIEIERAFKTQPEFLLLHFRNLLHLYALMHIHRVIASGQLVPGWILPPNSGWVLRESGDYIGTNHPIESQPIVRLEKINGENVFYVIPLDCRLIYPEPGEILNFDEKPLVPDSVNLVVSDGQAIAYGRSSSWTVVLYIDATGLIVGWTLILRGNSVDTMAIKLAINNGGGITATPKGYQTDVTLINDVQRLISSRSINPSRARPYILLTDGHGSRLTSNLLRILARNHIYCIIEPSHTSTFTQTLDQQAMTRLQTTYEKHLGVTISLDPHSPLTLHSRIRSLIHAIAELKDTFRPSLAKSWSRVGLPAGIIQPRKIDLKQFKTGEPFRHPTAIPPTNLLQKILSPENICAHPQADIQICFKQEETSWNNFVALSNLSTEGHTTVFSYFLQRSGNRRRSAIGSLMWNNRRLTGPDASIDNDIHSSDEEDDDQANSEGNSRGACGRISTADGRIISDPQVLEEIERLEEARREEARQRAERTEERERSDAYELPLTSILRSLNIVPRGVRPTKAHLIRLYTDYLEQRGGTWRMLFPLHGLRKNMVQSLLFFLVDNREMMQALSSTSSSSLLFSGQGTSSSPSSTTISSPSFLSCPQCLVLGAICNLCDGSVARWQDSSSSSSSLKRSKNKHLKKRESLSQKNWQFII